MTGSAAEPTPWGPFGRILRGLVRPLSPDQELAFAAETAETNRSRLLAGYPMMMVAHVLHIAAFWPSREALGAMNATLASWTWGVIGTHAATLVGAFGLWLLVLRLRGSLAWIHGPVAAGFYLLHAAVIVGVDQLNVTSATPYVGYAAGLAVVVCLTPREALVAYGLGLVAFVIGIVTMQESAPARQAILPNGFTVSAACILLVGFLNDGRRRDFLQRRTIQAQREELGVLNTRLERRVIDQHDEIVARAAEVDRLNAQLQARVRSRSAELTSVLQQLAEWRTNEGSSIVGLLLADRFEVGPLLGAGGMGSVHEGMDLVTGDRVAIKVIQARSADHLDSLHRFLREARASAAITHPAVVKMLHVDVSHDGMFFQVQELVDGETVHHLLHRTRRCAPPGAARLVTVLLEALAQAHEVGVIHRDVKPANLMITGTSPGLKLLDFGISKLSSDDTPEGQTGTGLMIGTPAFMAPEFLAGSRDVTEKADVWAAGVTLFMLLAGRHPFDNTSLPAMIVHLHKGQVPDVRTYAPEVPEHIANVVARCLVADPAERISAAEAARTLDALASPHSLDELVRADALGVPASPPNPIADLPTLIRPTTES